MTSRASLLITATVLMVCASAAQALRDNQGTLWKVESNSAWNGFAHQVVALPDLDGDGAADLAVGVFGESRVELRSGLTGEQLGELRGPESFGLQMILVPAQDGVAPALLVAAPLADGDQLDQGRVSLHALPSGELLWSRWGARSQARLGEDLGLVAGAVLAGTHGGPRLRLALSDGEASELVSAVLGASGPGPGSGLPHDRLAERTEQLGEDAFGWSLSSLGDLDGDGVDELLVGAPGDDAVATNAGAVHVVSGRTGRPLGVLYGRAANARFGSVVGSLGDLDGDGLPEIFVGGVSIDEREAAHGCVQVCRLPALALDTL